MIQLIGCVNSDASCRKCCVASLPACTSCWSVESYTVTKKFSSCKSASVSSGIESNVVTASEVVAAVSTSAGLEVSSGIVAYGVTNSNCTKNCIVNSGSVLRMELNSTSALELIA